MGRDYALHMIHEAHSGVVRMKSFVRSFMWWPGMDKDIETFVKKCTICQSSRKDPPVAPAHSWPVPTKTWTRVHIDYAGPLEGQMFSLITDTHSRWMEFHVTKVSHNRVTQKVFRFSRSA